MTLSKPYREFFFSSKEEYETLANLGALAWNAVVTSQDERDIDKDLSSIFPSEDREMHATIKLLVMDLIERKKKYFSEENRFIVRGGLKRFDCRKNRVDFHGAIRVSAIVGKRENQYFSHYRDF